MLKHMRQCGAVLWLPGWPPTYRDSRSIAGGNDEVGKTVESRCGTNDEVRRLLIRQAGAHDLGGRCYDN